MNEVVSSKIKARGPKTYFKGNLAIDGIWASEELEVTAPTQLPFNPELGDHLPVVVNITKTSLIGVSRPKIKPSAAKRLKSKVVPQTQNNRTASNTGRTSRWEFQQTRTGGA